MIPSLSTWLISLVGGSSSTTSSACSIPCRFTRVEFRPRHCPFASGFWGDKGELRNHSHYLRKWKLSLGVNLITLCVVTCSMCFARGNHQWR